MENDSNSSQKIQAKYDVLLAENRLLREQLAKLQSRLDEIIPPVAENPTLQDTETSEVQPLPPLPPLPPSAAPILPSLNNQSPSADKIKLFMSLFCGRTDVYARRWENKAKGTSGYSPACLNEWTRNVCRKPKVSCAACTHKEYAALDETVIDRHLRGELVAGVYPLLPDETCRFLAIDFDKGEWRRDVTTVADVCAEFEIPVAIERSRSGNGAHVWFFFQAPIPAVKARVFGSALLTKAMHKRHDIDFSSYDRLFPNQDTMPRGGLGNLIALPLQKEARNIGNSVFVDLDFVPYTDQWAFLSTIRFLDADEVTALCARLAPSGELGMVRPDGEDVESVLPIAPVWAELIRDDFPERIEIIRERMLLVRKNGLSQRALNRLKRLAVFKNPEFYRYQAMRMPTFGKPRLICCADETADMLCLPRGCEAELTELLAAHDVAVAITDATNRGKIIAVSFNGVLRDEQALALERLSCHNTGVLCASTAFGKTVTAIALIAARKVNTLIIVDKVSLLDQWRRRIGEFLVIDETLPEPEAYRKKRGRKKCREVVGQLGKGKNSLSGIIDIALMQSLVRKGEVHDCIGNYGMVIVDECHHVAAFSFEAVLKSAAVRYVYGLTATPARKDGHQPIIFMQCGPIRYRDDARQQAASRPFAHVVIPRFTSLRTPLGRDEMSISIQEHYANIVGSELRNQLICDDVIASHGEARNCLVLTERIAHVKLLADKLRGAIPDLITLTGGMGTKDTAGVFRRIAETSATTPLTLIATGRFIGEGFDEPRLDTLFLTMPISWKGTLQQYAGRLHRLHGGKSEVRIYDYVDLHIAMLERMYRRRLNGYAAIGYRTKSSSMAAEAYDIIFDHTNFLPVFTNDLLTARGEVVIVTPFITQRRAMGLMPHLESVLRSGVRVVVVTREIGNNGNAAAVVGVLERLQQVGVTLLLRPAIHQKFALLDQRIVWYGSVNLLGYGNAEESIMRLDSSAIAHELMKTVRTE